MVWKKARSESHEVEFEGSGIRVKNTSLFLDATRITDLSFISHAHSDHVAKHRKIIATAATLRFLSHRLGKLPLSLPAQFGQSFNLEGMEIELFPAGHILGSAQISIRFPRYTLVYTGDLNLAPSLTAEKAQIAPCDVLVIECTFGHPRYRFPPREETHQAIQDFAREMLEQNRVPIFLAYSLGKSQEAMHLLARAGFPLVAHSAIAELCAIYAELGYSIPFRRFDGSVHPGEVLFFPAHLARSRILKGMENGRTALLSGWAIDTGTRFRCGVHQAIPLSDHSDFEQLLQYVRESGAKKIYTVHGFTQEFAAYLRDHGWNAQPLIAPRQLELF